MFPLWQGQAGKEPAHEDMLKAQEAMQQSLPMFLNAMSKLSAYDINVSGRC